MNRIVNDYIDTDDLVKFGCKQYVYRNVTGDLIFSCEMNEAGDWIDTTEVEKLKIEIDKETAMLNKMTNKGK